MMIFVVIMNFWNKNKTGICPIITTAVTVQKPNLNQINTRTHHALVFPMYGSILCMCVIYDLTSNVCKKYWGFQTKQL